MSIKLKGSSDGSVSLDAPADTSPSGTDVTFVLPTADGTGNQVLSTDGSGNLSFADNVSSGRNLVQNGAMIVSQRGTSFDVNSEDKFTLDRFRTEHSSGTFECTITQESDGPQGFSKSLKVACDTTYTPVSSDNFGITTHLEGQDLQSLGFGSAGAKDLTLSFYVKGTAKQYSCAVQFVDSSLNRHIQSRSFNVTSSWQRVVLTFEGNGEALTTAIETGNTVGLELQWWLGAGPNDIFSEDTTWVDNPSPTFHAVTGQDNFFDSTSNEFYLTGVQLEVGSVATEFEHRSYGDELARCMRYLTIVRLSRYAPVLMRGSNGNVGSSQLSPLPVVMRTDPSSQQIDTTTLAIFSSLNSSTYSTEAAKISVAGAGGGTSYKYSFAEVANASNNELMVVADYDQHTDFLLDAEL